LRQLCGFVRGDLRGRERQAAPVVLPRFAARFGLLTFFAQPLGRAVAVVGTSLRDERRGRGAMTVVALRLEVRSVRSVDAWTFVPIEAEPAQPVEDAGHHLR
jgi:hypothetical protein